MKVLFQTRKNNFQGGDLIQMEETAKALRKLGVEVDISDEPFVKPEVIQAYDLVHLWNFPMLHTKYQLWVARKYKKPVVCSMIYSELDKTIDIPLQQIMLDELSYAIFQTEGERERVKRHLKLDESKSVIIPNGIDEWWFKKEDSRVFLEDFVLTVGRIEPSKGQLACALACKELKIPYVCIGEVRDLEYYAKLKQNGVIWYAPMPKEELKIWYNSAKVYIQPSEAETWSLCIDEALSQGTSVILTEMCERNDIDILRCLPNDIESIKISIRQAWKPKDYSRASKLKTWDNVAKQILELYGKIK